MQDPDLKCRHFVISWHFMAFWHVCQKANCVTKPAFSAFSRLFPPFRLFHRIRLLDFPALLDMSTSTSHVTANITTTMTWSKIVTESVLIGVYLVHKRERHCVNRQSGIPHTCQFWGTTALFRPLKGAPSA